ncbi:hypothetical protein IQ268_09200 [Oculatella sp. LEGE 06141]|uniref:hypothetical protein n=1 Tax=Oculatella sp. LEGE 06141 TaxID=1828648 RepID=UPI00187EBE4E|nr:hypothetical protein [Oculatella sp. LEGE 06141]MBE9178735.1 hypothetical protein [Oculatella sp. LEGE 06141]
MELEKITIRIPVSLKRRLKILCVETDQTIQEIASAALKEKIESLEKQQESQESRLVQAA